MESADLESYIGVRTRQLMAVFGKKDSDELLRVYKEALIRFPLYALKKAFHRAEQNLERFPTPKQMMTLCGESLASTGWKYSHAKVEAKDPETGQPITAYRDAESGDLLYRATDCPEGRAFLAKLRKIAGKAGAAASVGRYEPR